MSNPQVDIYLGPPGTGKTTTLLDIVESYLAKGTDPARIAYLAFTRKAANEAADRACARFHLTRDDLPYFRTIHSLAFQQLGLRNHEVLQGEHLREIGEAMGMTFKGHYDLDTDRPSLFDSDGDRCLTLYHLMRSRGTTIEQEWERANLDDLPFYVARDFAAGYEHYKRERNLLDFADMLEEYQSTLDLDLLIIDEAQDLTRQQWLVVNRLMEFAARVVVAGDDDQCIYRWAGADLDTFLKLKGEVHVLEKSHRLPENVAKVAKHITWHIHPTRRWKKTWSSTGEGGEVEWINDPEYIDLLHGTWYLLARHHYQLLPFVRIADQQGVIYQHNGRWSNETDGVKAVLIYEQLRKGERVKIREGLLASSFCIGARSKITHDQELCSFADFSWPFDGRPDWMAALTRLSPVEREYIRACKWNSERLIGPGRIIISTIHGVKGGEADSVLLLTDVNNRVFKSLPLTFEDEARVFYVGSSRAKKNLTLISPRTRRYLDIW